MKKKILLFMLSAIIVATTLKAAEKTDSSKVYFENAFTELKFMLEGTLPASFERAVFVSENAYWGNKYLYGDFKNVIDVYLYYIEKLIRANDRSDTMNFSVQVNANGRFRLDDIRYTEKEKKEMYENTLKNWAIFKYITDTTFIFPFYHPPFSYASNDPFGKKNWANSQVINLLASSKEQKGNCFALTGFFKILSDRLNAGAKICTAPQHIYIQHQDPKGDYYNVELATAGHPGDGMIQTLTYTTNEAVMSGIALRNYNEKESIGLCLVNLAKSYEHKFNTKDDEFILKCAELTLKHDSLNLNALLLKQQVLDERIISYAVKNKIKDINRLKTDQRISTTLSRLQKHLSKLYELGYRQMPFYMQQMILNGFSDEETGSIYATKNPSPFTTVKPKDKKDEQYWTLSHGAFQEVFEHKTMETYGHFTFNTETKTITTVDTSNQKGFIIDPVAFAYDFGARMYDARLGIFTSVDPKAGDFPNWSPYTAFADNPIYYVDPNGKKFINFDAAGNYVNTTHDNFFHNLFIGSKGRILDANGNATQKFRFADPKNDVKDIQSGLIKRLELVKEADVKKMMVWSGVFDSENKTSNRSWGDRYDYIKQEGKGGGKLDFSYTQIPRMYPDASTNPLDPSNPSPMIFLIDGVAHNHMNFGNFLFGAAGESMGITKFELKMGAEYNSLFNSSSNGYKPQFDSPDDQFSIGKGFDFGNKQNYQDREFKIEVGPLLPGTGVPEDKK